MYLPKTALAPVRSKSYIRVKIAPDRAATISVEPVASMPANCEVPASGRHTSRLPSVGNHGSR